MHEREDPAVTPSIRRLWTMYKRSVLEEGLGIIGRDHATILAQGAFYGGARGVFKVLAYMLERGDVEEMHDLIQRQGRQLKKLQELAPQARWH